MKNFIFAFVFMATGTFMFGTTTNDSQEGCTQWTTFISCGQTFHLCDALYESPDEMLDFAQEMHDLRCAD